MSQKVCLKCGAVKIWMLSNVVLGLDSKRLKKHLNTFNADWQTKTLNWIFKLY